MPETNPTNAAVSPQPRSRPGAVRWTIAIVLLALAAWAGWHTYRVLKQRNVVQYIDDLGGVVAYDFEDTDPETRDERPSGPSPIASVLGNDYVHDVVDVNLRTTDKSSLGDEDLQRVSSLTAVRTLSISNGGEVTDEGLELLARMPRLRTLRLVKFPNVTDAGLAVLARLPELRKLDMVSLPKITDEGLRHLAELNDLRELTITDCEINGSGWRYLSTAGLQFIEATSCKVNDEALAHLAGAKGLEELSATQNEIRGAGLSHLKGLPKLARLRLGENLLVPAEAVPNLKALTSLELLNVRETPIDRKSGEELAKALPECDIMITGASYDPEEGQWRDEGANQE